ncbi:regulatory LuxR family protein [Streptomyces sp. TLI_171]|nr:regulatory LuxR family protein [Streptomyces sp. TLI_171]
MRTQYENGLRSDDDAAGVGDEGWDMLRADRAGNGDGAARPAFPDPAPTRRRPHSRGHVPVPPGPMGLRPAQVGDPALGRRAGRDRDARGEGARGKGAAPAELLSAVRTVAAGEALLSPAATRAVIEQFLAQPGPAATGPPAERLAVLTAREREVMAMAATGVANEEIAERMFVSPFTIRTHIHRAMAKLDARDRAQLVAIAYQSGLVPPHRRARRRTGPDRRPRWCAATRNRSRSSDAAPPRPALCGPAPVPPAGVREARMTLNTPVHEVFRRRAVPARARSRVARSGGVVVTHFTA